MARIPLSCSAFDKLLAIENARPSIHTVSRLRCVFRLSPTIRILHPSFRDFLSDRGRCRKDIWFLDLTLNNRLLAVQCMDRLRKVLKRNICGSVLSPEPVAETLPEDVSYACTFWIDHVCWVTNETPSIAVHVENILRGYLLNWLEAMSCLRISRDTVGLLNRLLQWLMVSPLFFPARQC